MADCNQIKTKIGKFLERELSERERQEVGEHLINCAECRREHDLEKEGRSLASALEGVDAPPEVWDGVRSKIGSPPSTGSRSRMLKPVLSFAAAVIAMLLAVPFYVYFTSGGESTAAPDQDGEAPWKLEDSTGAPRITELAAGGVLETDSDSSARITIADIGRVDVSPNSKVRIVDTGAAKHRMSLERGKLKAEILAPPRLFIVDTPSATAVDLGCAYTLEVKDDGSARLHVTSGYVALETGDLESFVPAGAFCESRKGGRLGTPFFGAASAELKKSLSEFDFGNGGRDAVETVIREATRKDTLTLWHLLPKVSEDQRAAIVTRIARETELDDGVTFDGLIRLDREMMMELRSDLEVLWYEEPGWFD